MKNTLNTEEIVNGEYLKETEILNYTHPSLQQLIQKQKWLELDIVKRTKAIYSFVKDDIAFGYNTNDNIKASKVLQDKYGQCNTKSTLLMALLRAVGIPNRLHGFTIDKALQKGAITGIWYQLAPRNIVHTWVEVYVNENWYNLEGVILDKPYLLALQRQNSACKTSFCGYGVYTKNFEKPDVEWDLNHTYIQKEGINQDFGLFNDPDEFYQHHGQKLNFLKRFVYEKIVRHKMNNNVDKIRRNEHF